LNRTALSRNSKAVKIPAKKKIIERAAERRGSQAVRCSRDISSILPGILSRYELLYCSKIVVGLRAGEDLGELTYASGQLLSTYTASIKYIDVFELHQALH